MARVVVTRPEISARRTAERLQHLGHQPVLLPLARPIHYPDIAETALGTPHAALAVTSAEAVRVLASLAEAKQGYDSETLYAVGEATARTAREIGFRYIRTGQGTGSDLIAMIAADLQGSDNIAGDLSDPLLYLAGRPRSASFEENAAAQGIPLVIAEIYEMHRIDHDREDIHRLLCKPQADIVLLYSHETAHAFFELTASFADALAGIRFLCLSGAVAAAVPMEFHGNIKIAGQPSEDGLFALL